MFMGSMIVQETAYAIGMLALYDLLNFIGRAYACEQAKKPLERNRREDRRGSHLIRTAIVSPVHWVGNGRAQLSSAFVSIDAYLARTLKLRTEKIKEPPHILFGEQFDFYGHWFLRLFPSTMDQ